MAAVIIAELGINTNGNLPRALSMVEAAAQAGCDGVKVQAYETGDFLPKDHKDWDMFERNRLDWWKIEAVRKHAAKHGLLFGGTPTSAGGVVFLDDIDADYLKNGSDFLPRTDLILTMLRTKRPTWVSVGMATELEIRRLPRAVHKMLCTSLYPCPPEAVGLPRLLKGYDGFSDHTTGNLAACVAAFLLARNKNAMIEKHFTLDHAIPGPDHKFSANPQEMRWLVENVREVERMAEWTSEGLVPEESANRVAWRVKEGALRP